MSAPAVFLAASPAASAAKPGRGSYVVPGGLEQFLHRIDEWLLESQRKALRDGLKLWTLKLLAILAAGAAAVTALVTRELGLFAAVLNSVACICLILDGLLHPGGRRILHLRAVEGLRNLRKHLESRWLIASCEGRASSGTLLQILEDGWKEWKRITAYVE